MNSPDDDALATMLAELPEPVLDPRVRAAVHREARAALTEDRGARVAHVWSTVVLPLVLVGCAVVYAVDAFQCLEHTYVASDR
ncbi:MAG: hypothetical protein HOW73_38295 [Polyangiaceae bacterium]|nr:hypothetical protein [Polyangiaceae bacterium]